MGQEERTAVIINATFVRPAAFYLTGFLNLPYDKYYYIFLCFVYIMTVIGNGFLLLVIYLVETLHTPKYMIVFNLAFTDLCGSTALIPKILDTFLFNNRYIAYEACLSYLFFVWFFTSVQSWTLFTMAYDRFVAICFPLRYHSIVTKPAIAAMLLFTWLAVLGLIACMAGLLNRLSFCASLVIQSFYCDHGPLFRLSCNERVLNNIFAYLVVTVAIVFPCILIALTYVCIGIALSKIAPGVKRIKALKTCTSHLILVAIFFLPTMATNVAAMISSIHPDARIINSTLTHTVPALLNPIIYSLKTEEVLKSIKNLWKKNWLRHLTSPKRLHPYPTMLTHKKIENNNSFFLLFNITK